ncbi:MAG TPA: rhomboid family intramembrane serine protease [Acidobacteriota bacterium]|jgi:membrane associated rhomboid family serine protease|nr:rhomboid family intramembrane serine protease [Acidobacteriota bacterium]
MRDPRYQVSFGPPITPAVKYLIIANVVVYLMQQLAPEMLMMFGLSPLLVTHKFFFWQLGTYLFLHGPFTHILFNMFGLWMFGSDLERYWGPRFFLRYYFLTGIGAGLLSVIVNPTSPQVTIGASGAIYGVLLAYGMMFPNRMLLLYFIVPIKAKYFVTGLGVVAFISALQAPGGPIAHLAHLGGMLFGLIYLKGWISPLLWRGKYQQWRMQRLRRKFQVYQRDRNDDDYTVH